MRMNGAKNKSLDKKYFFFQQTIVEKILCALSAIIFCSLGIVTIFFNKEINSKIVIAIIGCFIISFVLIHILFTGFIIVDNKKNKVYTRELFHKKRILLFNEISISLNENEFDENIWSIVIQSEQGYIEIKSWDNGPAARMTFTGSKKQKQRIKKFINKLKENN